MANLQTEAERHAFLEATYHQLRSQLAARPEHTLPEVHHISALQSKLVAASAASPTYSPSGPRLPPPLGDSGTLSHILHDVVPALTGQSTTARYYGFVTGGTLTAAEAADNVVSALDQNCGGHLPAQSASGFVEDAALRMLISLLDLGAGEGDWPGRTLTTGATASNVLGLACGRDAVLRRRLERKGAGTKGGGGVAEMGLLGACAAVGVREVQVLTSLGHSSLYKAASVVGLGRASVKELPYSRDQPWRLDLDAVERELQRDGVASIVAVSAGEVNTGRFATTGVEDMRRLRELADRHDAWIHVDGAFGIFARALPKFEANSDRPSAYHRLVELSGGLELADSITADAHKALNVPYDCGIFLTRRLDVLQDAFANANAAYLTPPPSRPSAASATIPQPLNTGIENSRRFRALPVYAALRSLGLPGVQAMLARMVDLARALARWLRTDPAARELFELLPGAGADGDGDDDYNDLVHMIVLFRARDPAVNDALVDRINASREVYVSGSVWAGQKVARVAVSSWRVDVERDLPVLKRVLLDAAKA